MAKTTCKKFTYAKYSSGGEGSAITYTGGTMMDDYLAKVDIKLRALGVLYIVTGLLYLLFEKVVINCRPVLMEGETVPEASFPSSHTVLAVVIFGSIAMIVQDYLDDKRLAGMLQNICLVLLIVAVLGRLFSCVHWFTDILGGLFLSFALLQAFSGALDKLKTRPE